MGGMTTKIAVSLPDDQVEAARAAVAEGRAPSVSAYVSEALARRSAEDELLDLLDEDERELPATEEHRAWARRALGVSTPGAERTPRGRRFGKTGSHRR
jgi:Arc/MetJ-type ribon-helix-helix transcriptional regulator